METTKDSVVGKFLQGVRKIVTPTVSLDSEEEKLQTILERLLDSTESRIVSGSVGAGVTAVIVCNPETKTYFKVSDYTVKVTVEGRGSFHRRVSAPVENLFRDQIAAVQERSYREVESQLKVLGEKFIDEIIEQ